MKYASGLDLLRQTPDFVAEVRAKRLDREFHRAYRFLEVLYGGRNPYMEAIDRNMEYLRQVLRSENWRLLRRRPPIFAATRRPDEHHARADARAYQAGLGGRLIAYR